MEPIVENMESRESVPTSSRPTRTQVIKDFLSIHTHADLAKLYSLEMECQVIVAKGDGKPVEMEFRGREYRVYKNASNETWKSFRIPYNAGSKPEYTDVPMTYAIDRHAEGIGMTGWNWVKKESIFVAFDFDAMVGHNKGLLDTELEEVKQKAIGIPWVTIRKSTSGRGLHIYVFLEPVSTQTHHEHAALARAILNKMSALTGFDFNAKVDICGGNMWVWHRKMFDSANKRIGLDLVKSGEVLKDIPSNWQAHLKVTKRLTRRSELNLPVAEPSTLNSVLNERALVPLDDEHVRVIKELEGTDSWWDADHHLLCTHTWTLKQIHQKLDLKGKFDTISMGTEQGHDHNCFAVPRPKGAWLVRRYNKVEETMPWAEDTWGYMACFYNKEPDFKTLCMSAGAIETEKRGMLFYETDKAQAVLTEIGQNIGVVANLYREVTLRQDNEGRVVVKIKREASDTSENFKGFEPNKDNTWTKIIRAQRRTDDESEATTYDDVIRHLVGEGKEGAGWVIATETGFVTEPLIHAKLALKARGFTLKEVESITGASVISPWKIVCQPFDQEYPGNRCWNLRAPQLSYQPKEDGEHLDYSFWSSILAHLGKGLDDAITNDKWCQENSIETGADYLKCWCASLFQYPQRPLPYLFFVGPQNCGKSIFHEALAMLFSPGYMLADNALRTSGDFNGELLNSVLCVVEEVDLSDNKLAYNRIKDWVTSPRLLVHQKGVTPFLMTNTTHWIQCANDARYCPIFPGDTRIVMIQVEELGSIIARREMDEKLKSQAADFITEILRMELPVSPDRLNLPPITTEAKRSVEISNESDVDIFISEHVFEIAGAHVSLEELHSAFTSSLTPSMASRWSKNRLNKHIPQDRLFVKGRLPSGEHVWGNMSLTPDPKIQAGKIWKRKLGTVGDYLHLVNKEGESNE